MEKVGWEKVEAGEGGNKTCDAVGSQAEVPDVKLRRKGEAMEKMICGVWFPTAAFGASQIEKGVWSIFVAFRGFAKPRTKLGEGCSVDSGKGFFTQGPQ